jgi:hypothetical protein
MKFSQYNSQEAVDTAALILLRMHHDATTYVSRIENVFSLEVDSCDEQRNNNSLEDSEDDDDVAGNNTNSNNRPMMQQYAPFAALLAAKDLDQDVLFSRQLQIQQQQQQVMMLMNQASPVQATVLVNSNQQLQLEGKVQCPCCLAIFGRKAGLRRHIREVHKLLPEDILGHGTDKSPVLECRGCGRKYIRSNDLTRHMRYHCEPLLKQQEGQVMGGSVAAQLHLHALAARLIKSSPMVVPQQGGAAGAAAENSSSPISPERYGSAATPAPSQKYSCVKCDQTFTYPAFLATHMLTCQAPGLSK